MSDAGAADEWDVVVPEDGEQLLDELRRHGVEPGQRLHVRSATSGKHRSSDTASAARWTKPTGAMRSAKTGNSWSLIEAGGARSSDEARTRSDPEPEFIGSFDSGQPDLAERSQEILRAHFPDR